MQLIRKTSQYTPPAYIGFLYREPKAFQQCGFIIVQFVVREKKVGQIGGDRKGTGKCVFRRFVTIFVWTTKVDH